jgi:hypothetical protein
MEVAKRALKFARELADPLVELETGQGVHRKSSHEI